MLKRRDQLKCHWRVNNLWAIVADMSTAVMKKGKWFLWMANHFPKQGPTSPLMLVSPIRPQWILEDSLVATSQMGQVGLGGQKGCLWRSLWLWWRRRFLHQLAKIPCLVCRNHSLQSCSHQRQSSPWNRRRDYRSLISLKWCQNSQWHHQNHRFVPTLLTGMLAHPLLPCLVFEAFYISHLSGFTIGTPFHEISTDKQAAKANSIESNFAGPSPQEKA